MPKDDWIVRALLQALDMFGIWAYAERGLLNQV